jgi:hypothetical protein
MCDALDTNGYVQYYYDAGTSLQWYKFTVSVVPVDFGTSLQCHLVRVDYKTSAILIFWQWPVSSSIADTGKFWKILGY